jgi:hypothetical protein
MYQFAGGKDSDITPATFLPKWWFDYDGGEPAEETREAKMAKFAKVFERFGGKPPADGS